MIRIRKIDPLDHIDDIAAFQAELFGPDPRWPDDGHDDWWFAFLDDAPVAFAVLAPSAQWRGAGYFARAGVLPAARGLGLQKRLIRARLAQARRYQWSHVVCDTMCNPTSANNLISCGFRSYIPARPWGFERSSYWIRRL